MMTNDDDEDVFTVGRLKLRITNNVVAPLEETKMRVLVEYSGSGNLESRIGLDLVMVLDVSLSMNARQNLQKLQTAMELVIYKLSDIDRLSVITCSSTAIAKLCPLQWMTESSKEEIKLLVSGISPGSHTNTRGGLEMGLKVLSDRGDTCNRVGCIMLVTTGEQDEAGDVAQVQIGKVQVHTFNYLSEDDHLGGLEDVPYNIARNSYGGTFSVVTDTNDLSVAFAQCLAGLLTISVRNVELIMTAHNESRITNVYAGIYLPLTSPTSVTIAHGNFSDKEVHKVLVDLLLPRSREVSKPILSVTYRYVSNKYQKTLRAPSIFVSVRRSPLQYTKQEDLRVQIEANRLQAALMMKEARILADNSQLEEARNELLKAENILENVNIDSPVIYILKDEVKQLSILMESDKIYRSIGRPFALCSELSHERQRFAERGDWKKLRLFATPRMDEYQQQAKQFPEKPLPTIKEDLRKERAKDRLCPCCICPCFGTFTSYIRRAIEDIRSIDNVVDRDARY